MRPLKHYCLESKQAMPLTLTLNLMPKRKGEKASVDGDWCSGAWWCVVVLGVEHDGNEEEEEWESLWERVMIRAR